MIWQRGYTAETGTGTFEKIKITLDEDDLARLLLEHAPGVDPAKMRLVDVFRLMEGQAEYLIQADRLIRLDVPDEKQATERVRALATALKADFTRIRSHYGDGYDSG